MECAEQEREAGSPLHQRGWPSARVGNRDGSLPVWAFIMSRMSDTVLVAVGPPFPCGTNPLFHSPQFSLVGCNPFM
jgi:hypothetical protein